MLTVQYRWSLSEVCVLQSALGAPSAGGGFGKVQSPPPGLQLNRAAGLIVQWKLKLPKNGVQEFC